MENTSNTMVSRSLRIKPDTLSYLEKLAKENNMGITVYIRSVLENHVGVIVQERYDASLAKWE